MSYKISYLPSKMISTHLEESEENLNYKKLIIKFYIFTRFRQ